MSTPENMSGYAPEVPFGRRDSPETVASLREELAKNGVHAINVDGLNRSGRDCVYLSMMHGVKPDRTGRRRVRDDDNRDPANKPIAFEMEEKTVSDIRKMLADHIEGIWDMAGHWARDSLRLHSEHEARHYYDMECRPVEEVMQRYCKAIRGEDEPGMYGDVGVMLAFASRFNVKLLVFTPPVVVNTRTNTTKLYRPFVFGARSVDGRGRKVQRATSYMMIYVLAEGLAHAEPLSTMSVASRWTGACPSCAKRV